MTDLEHRLREWIPTVAGEYLNEDWNPTNRGFGAQCWDVPANWSKSLGLPVINTGGPGRWPGWAGNMVDAFPQTPEIAAAYELIGPDEPGLPGDIPVWDDSYAYYPKTHVAVLVRDGAGLLLCMSQNSSSSLPGNPYAEWTTGPTILQHLPRRGLLGFIRPRARTIAPMGATTTEEDEDMAISDDDARKIARFLLDEVVTTEDNKPATLRWFLASERKARSELIAAVLDGLFGRKIKVEGEGEAGETSFAAEIGWFRNNFRRAQK